MNSETFEYVLAFTIAHEGDTPFMYNNWPLKNPNRDVTVGVGLALDSSSVEAGERVAASNQIRSMFRVKGTGLQASEDEMKAEFRRVYDLKRTLSNLRTDFQDQSPLEMDRTAMLNSLRQTMLGWWGSKGQNFPNFGAIPAQAQIALMSYNYGARLSIAPNMCNAVRAGDYVRAAEESLVPGWDGQKNAGHKRLLMNAATIVRGGLDLGTLPPKLGPFKPPPLVSGGTTTPGADVSQLAGSWSVTIGGWSGFFFFDAIGGVSWAEDESSPGHAGRWSVNGSSLEWKFRDPGDFRTFTLPLPLITTNAAGTILPAGQGWFTMSKHGVHSSPIR
jgi:hypothetical protein